MEFKRGIDPKKAMNIGLSNRDLILRWVLDAAKSRVIGIISDLDYEDIVFGDAGIVDLYNERISLGKEGDSDELPKLSEDEMEKDYYGNPLNYWPNEKEIEWVMTELSKFSYQIDDRLKDLVD